MSIIIIYTVSWIFTVNVLLYILGYSRVSLYTTVQQDLLRTQEGDKEFREIGEEYHHANTLLCYI